MRVGRARGILASLLVVSSWRRPGDRAA